MRMGAPLAVAANFPAPASAASAEMGRSDSNAGSARHAPRPRRKWRRLRLANRSAAVLRFIFMVYLACALYSDAGRAAVVVEMFRRFWKGADSTIPVSRAEN